MIVDVRKHIDEALTKGLEEAGLQNTPETRKSVLRSMVREFEKNRDYTFSVTEKLWWRKFISQANAMLEETS